MVVAAAGRAGENRTRPPGEPHQFGGASPADSVGTQGSHAEAPTPGPIGGTDSSLPGLWKMEKNVQGINAPSLSVGTIRCPSESIFCEAPGRITEWSPGVCDKAAGTHCGGAGSHVREVGGEKEKARPEALEPKWPRTAPPPPRAPLRHPTPPTGSVEVGQGVQTPSLR